MTGHFSRDSDRFPGDSPHDCALVDILESSIVSEVYDCTGPDGLEAGIAAAVAAVQSGQVIVLPTDTVYGVGCDAFSAEAVAAVLVAKGRGRELPPPVLVPNPRTVDGLAREVSDHARALIDAYWPGPLTLVLKAQTSLQWDLGETNGTVALRMPDDPVALAVLAAIGPMAVTSANTTGHPPAGTVGEARNQLGEAVAVYLDGGPSSGGPASTILDCTGELPVVLRPGALEEAKIETVCDQVLAEQEAAAAREEAAVAAEREQLRRRAQREQAERDRAADPRRRPGPKIAGSRRRK